MREIIFKIIVLGLLVAYVLIPDRIMNNMLNSEIFQTLYCVLSAIGVALFALGLLGFLVMMFGCRCKDECDNE